MCRVALSTSLFRKKIGVGLLVAALLLFVGCSTEQQYRRSIIDQFDTVTTVTAVASEQEFDEIFNHVSELIDSYHRLFDAYNEYDGVVNIATLNEVAHAGPVAVSQELFDFLLYSKEMYELTDGHLNIAFGAVLQLWQQAQLSAVENPDNAEIPSIEELSEASKHCDINDLILNAEELTVYFADDKLRLDVGSIAKGYTAGLVAHSLYNNGFDDTLLSMGGNIVAVGNIDSKSWTAGVEDPQGNSEPIATLTLNGGESLVVSGDYVRYFTVDDINYGHIIDSETLMPPEYYSSVAVISNDAALADVLSTALFTMPSQEAIALVEQLPSVEVMLIVKDMEAIESSGFKNHVV